MLLIRPTLLIRSTLHFDTTDPSIRPVFFGHLTPAVEDLRYQHMYHPVPVEERCPALAAVLNAVSSGQFGDGGVYEPYVLFVYAVLWCPCVIVTWMHLLSLTCGLAWLGSSTRLGRTTTTCLRRTLTLVSNISVVCGVVSDRSPCVRRHPGAEARR